MTDEMTKQAAGLLPAPLLAPNLYGNHQQDIANQYSQHQQCPDSISDMFTVRNKTCTHKVP